MISGPMLTGSDEQIVDSFRKLSIQYSKCGLNSLKASHIMDTQLRPAYETLKNRGDIALRKLLPLTDDQNPTVRWIAAGFAYDVDPGACRRVLEEVMKQRGRDGMMAWVTLSARNLDALPDPPKC